MCGYRNKFLLLSAFVLLISTQGFAQRLENRVSDTLASIRDIIRVGAFTQQLPLFVSMRIKNTTNIVTSPEDTSSQEGEFFVQKNGSYIHVGEMEQLLNDSLALIISNNLQKMFVYTTVQPITTKLKSLAGLQLPKSSLLEIANRFSAKTTDPQDSVRLVELTSRSFVFQTQFPKETIQFSYSVSRQVPIKMRLVKRTPVPIDEAQYQVFKVDNNFQDRLVSTAGGEYFLVKEQTTEYQFLAINHDQRPLPVTARDRIHPLGANGFSPAKGYETYNIIIN